MNRKFQRRFRKHHSPSTPTGSTDGDVQTARLIGQATRSAFVMKEYDALPASVREKCQALNVFPEAGILWKLWKASGKDEESMLINLDTMGDQLEELFGGEKNQ